MAKYRHRTFEMYEFRDEAVKALTPRSMRDKVDPVDPGLWTFCHFATSLSEGVTLITFKEAMKLDADADGELKADSKPSATVGYELALIGRSLSNDSRVVMDFAGVPQFDTESIEALTQFKGSLQSKGSQLALCNLEKDVHAAFFPNRS